MADKEQIKKTADKVLFWVERFSSLAASIDPIFGVVSGLVGLMRKGLVAEEDHPLEKDFREIHNKLESISNNNMMTLKQIAIDEVNENFGTYEEYIKHQYAAFSEMVEHVKMHPEAADQDMAKFENIYERDMSDMSLNVYYRGVMGTDVIFGRALLKVYLEHCNYNLMLMEHRCSHLAHLFHIGLISLMAYTSVTKDNEDEVRDKWIPRMEEIHAKMQDALRQCK
ncbi:protein rapunzel-like [Conger conger]|uniref:protein rapunzel-like n=1 Tax=Conger conger TaxID=82655 RepID=UPI002A5A077F|nr:protein rapunzel-like [Conger conger]